MKNTKRALRRWQTEYHQRRRLKEDRNQHSTDRYNTGDCYTKGYIASGVPINSKFHCACFWDPKAMARFKEQPKRCTCCCSPRWDPMVRGLDRLTLQERRFLDIAKSYEV